MNDYSPDITRLLLSIFTPAVQSAALVAAWRAAQFGTESVLDASIRVSLARFNNNYDQLFPKAKSAATALGLHAPCFNPFMITAAQIVECIHCVEESLHLVHQLLETGSDSSAVQSLLTPAPGTGVGAVEAPRGTLFHEYAYDEKGYCLSANLVIPTAQNLGNLEKDLQTYGDLLGETDDEMLVQQLSMLVRAYDPLGFIIKTYIYEIMASFQGIGL